MDKTALSLFHHRIIAVCDEMGAGLRCAAFSPNIRDRLDYSCAIFDSQGRLTAQAAHIPVHIGSMAYALHRLVGRYTWREGDMLIFNDPYYGGTHLPDVTVLAPVFVDQQLLAFVANRAHHADIGATSPGGMPLSRSLAEEGTVIEPKWLAHDDCLDESLLRTLVADSCQPQIEWGDYAAQFSSNRIGAQRLQSLIGSMGDSAYRQAVSSINHYAEQLVRDTVAELPDGEWAFTDYMDDDGFAAADIPVRVKVSILGERLCVDFAGTAGQVEGNINCPISVTAAAVYYVIRCLLPDYTPNCHGSFSAIELKVPPHSLLNADRHAAVVGGNVETSSRIVDCLLGAVGQFSPECCVAASQGTMNNVAMGSVKPPKPWAYMETLAGGCGAGREHPGLSATHSHMTNTRNTSIEVLEMCFPLRLNCYALRKNSGGEGLRRGGDGLVREYEFLDEAQITILSERRRRPPWGVGGGQAACMGENRLNGRLLPGKAAFRVKAGDRLSVATPGGGGYKGRQDNKV